MRSLLLTNVEGWKTKALGCPLEVWAAWSDKSIKINAEGFITPGSRDVNVEFVIFFFFFWGTIIQSSQCGEFNDPPRAHLRSKRVFLRAIYCWQRDDFLTWKLLLIALLHFSHTTNFIIPLLGELRLCAALRADPGATAHLFASVRSLFFKKGMDVIKSERRREKKKGRTENTLVKYFSRQ